MTVTQANSTLVAIRRLVRHLTNSPGENSLTTAFIDEKINDIYNTDFAYAIKTDQMRDTYEIYTEPFREIYPLDVNYIQSVRDPVYFDGTQGGFYKDRKQFFNLWPRILTEFTPATGDNSDQQFPFTIQGPFLRREVLIGSRTSSGADITVKDDGEGNLYSLVDNAQTSTPLITAVFPTGSLNAGKPIPGMFNRNLVNPGLNTLTLAGTVNYETGVFSLDLSAANLTPGNNEPITVKVSQYQTGRPYTLLFWNNEFHVRPVPEKIHKIEVEIYLTPVQFMSTTDDPIVNQWWKYIAYLTSAEIQRERNDFDAVNVILEGAERQEGLVLERQANEEIGTPNYTLFNSNEPNPSVNNYWGIGI